MMSSLCLALHGELALDDWRNQRSLIYDPENRAITMVNIQRCIHRSELRQRYLSQGDKSPCAWRRASAIPLIATMTGVRSLVY